MTRQNGNRLGVVCDVQKHGNVTGEKLKPTREPDSRQATGHIGVSDWFFISCQLEALDDGSGIQQLMIARNGRER
jgi:hypothetical protein